ncbi:hypothetical protein LV75_000643 [Actinokineospora diospyrosa]|uniref:Uncharacterized protein n=1 Tax=Actinokineospora diospyrosa TaxID=103728 RepID=A0ABT1I6B1_9PSEU|nr:hypothetical protein [Actinokineospora diospyrosa]
MRSRWSAELVVSQVNASPVGWSGGNPRAEIAGSRSHDHEARSRAAFHSPRNVAMLRTALSKVVILLKR